MQLKVTFLMVFGNDQKKYLYDGLFTYNALALGQKDVEKQRLSKI